MGYGGMAQGFAQGFGLVDDYVRKNKQEERQAEYDLRAEQLHGIQMEKHKNDLELAPIRLQSAKTGQDLAAINLKNAEFANKHLQADYDAQVKLRNTQQLAADFKLSNERFQQESLESVNLVNQVAMLKPDEPMSEDILGRIADSSEKRGSLFYQWRGDLRDAEATSNMIDRYFQGEATFEEALPALQVVSKGSSAQYIGMKMSDGRTVTDAKIAGFKPAKTEDGRDGIVPIMTFSFDSGEPMQRPVTQMRLLEGEDQEKVIGVDELYERHFAQKSMLAVLKATGAYDKIQTGMSNHYARLNNGKALTGSQQISSDAFSASLKDLRKLQMGEMVKDMSGETSYHAYPESVIMKRELEIEQMADLNPQIARLHGFHVPSAQQVAEVSTQFQFKSPEAQQSFINSLQAGRISRQGAIRYLQTLERIPQQSPVPTPQPNPQSGNVATNKTQGSDGQLAALEQSLVGGGSAPERGIQPNASQQTAHTGTANRPSEQPVGIDGYRRLGQTMASNYEMTHNILKNHRNVEMDY